MPEKQGHKDAFLALDEQLAKDIWAQLYRYIYYRVQNREEAEELTQETFKRVQPQIDAGKVRKGKVMPYYFATAKNLIAEVWRDRAGRPAEISMDELAGRGWEPTFSAVDTGTEDTLLLKEALQKLSFEHRRVLTLRVIEGWSVKAAAQKMGRTPGALRSLQFRAVQALKELLVEGGYFDE